MTKTTSRSESSPKCDACDDVGSWLVGVRLPNDEQVKLCPPCARRVEQFDTHSHDWSDPRHPDNKVHNMPTETRRSFSFCSRPALTEAIMLEDKSLGSRTRFQRDPALRMPSRLKARPKPENKNIFRAYHEEQKEREKRDGD
jgi:hypothetical protein